MTPTVLRTIIAAAFILEFMLSFFLTAINLGNVLKNRKNKPSFLNGYVKKKQYKEACRYTLKKGHFSLFTLIFNTLLLFIVLYTGVLGKTYNWVSGLVHGFYWSELVTLAIYGAVLSIISFPLEVYCTFILEEEFGFNKTTLKTYFSDKIKSTIVSLIMMFILVVGLLFLQEKLELWFNQWWWLPVYGAFFAYEMIVNMLYPVVIAPLFNKFTPLEDGELKDELADLAEKCNFKTKDIMTMDGSRRSGHSNAYFTGLGKVKRIVLFDTLIDQLSVKQLKAVLAHEIGHYKKHHIIKRIIASTLFGAAGFWILSLAMQWNTLFTVFGFQEAAFFALIIILGMVSSPLSFLLKPLFSSVSRRSEYQADNYAKDIMGSGTELKESLLILGKKNLSNFTPHKLYSSFHYSHPTLSERIKNLEDKLNASNP